MTLTPRPYRILVAIDFSDTSRHATRQAIALARTEPLAELHAVTVIEHPKDVLPRSDLPDFEPRIQEVSQSLAAAVHAELGSALPVPSLFCHVRLGHPAEEIVRLSLELRADLVVVGTAGRRGVRRLLMGSVAETVMRLAPCPVLAVREPDFRSVAGLPEPEPPCPDCEATRARTHGNQWWCACHDRPPLAPHVYHASSAPPGGNRTGILW